MEIQEEQGYEVEEYEGKGFTITASALQHGIEYYRHALRMYGNADSTNDWTDLLGLLTPTEAVEQIKEDILSEDIDNITTLESRFRDIYDSYDQWKGISDNDSATGQAHEEWLNAIRLDAEREYGLGDVSEDQIADFLNSVN